MIRVLVAIVLVLTAVVATAGPASAAPAGQDAAAQQAANEEADLVQQAWAVDIRATLKTLHEQGNMIQTALQRQKKRTFRLQGLLIASILINLAVLGLLLWRFRGGSSALGTTSGEPRAEARKPVRVGGIPLRQMIVVQATTLAVLVVIVLLVMFGI